MSILIFVLKKKYFEEVKNGTKKVEYRIYKDYWVKRLVGKTFDGVQIRHPYKNPEILPLFPWKGYVIETIQHDEFGPDPVKVFAIKLER